MSSSVSAPVTVSAASFTGVSKFATSLQQVLSRAVSIASLPLQSLEAGLTTLEEKQQALESVDSAFTELQSSISAIQTTVSSGLLSPTVADSTIASATVGATATEGTYSLEVDSLGAPSTAVSVAGSTAVTDPTTQGITSSSSVNLTVGGSSITITPAGDTLQDLATAINNVAGSGVQATLVNVGSTASPDYRLSLSSVNLGSDAITLTDSSGNSLVASSTTGSEASYEVDGTTVQSNTRTVTLAPGLTVNLLGQSAAGTPTTITVANDPSNLEAAFTAFASAYNSAVTALAAQHGQNAGALQGDSILSTLQQVLTQLGTFTNGSPENSLANFGITVDSTGNMSVDSATFANAAATDFDSLVSTIGGATTGGFLEMATNLMTSLEDPTTGAIKNDETTLANQITSQNSQISDEQSTVDQLQSSLTTQISNADSTIAGLENEVTFVTGLFAQYTGATNTQSNGLSTL